MKDQNGRILEEGMAVVYFEADNGTSTIYYNYKPNSELRQASVVDVSGVLAVLSDGAVIAGDKLIII